MYSKKFENVTKLLQSYIDNQDLVGASILIVKANKEIYRENIGYANKEKDIPISDNTIYKLFSMTNPITAVAMMILFERGAFDLYDSVSKFIPAYKNQKVVTPNGIVSAQREITIKDLLTMTVGIPYPNAYTVSGLEMNKLFSRMNTDIEKGNLWNSQKFVEAIASIPMAFQPGEYWLYGLSADIVGALVEVISQKSLSEFLKEEIFEPLDMGDTDFYIPKEKKEHFCQLYEMDKLDHIIPFTKKQLYLNSFFISPAFESGGTGLYSTVNDYAKFSNMLLNEGIFNCQRILSRKTIEFMTSNHLTAKQAQTFDWDKLRGYGYGMFMRTMLNPIESGALSSVGEFGWDGWAGNWFCVDPKEKLIIVYMMQQANENSNRFVSKLKNTIYSVFE